MEERPKHIRPYLLLTIVLEKSSKPTWWSHCPPLDCNPQLSCLSPTPAECRVEFHKKGNDCFASEVGNWASRIPGNQILFLKEILDLKSIIVNVEAFQSIWHFRHGNSICKKEHLLWWLTKLIWGMTFEMNEKFGEVRRMRLKYSTAGSSIEQQTFHSLMVLSFVERRKWAGFFLFSHLRPWFENILPDLHRIIGRWSPV